jgi:hypothetical protein
MEGELGEVYEAPAVKIVENIDNPTEVGKSGDAPPAAAPEGSKQPGTNVVANTLIARKKPIPATKSDMGSEKKKVTFGDPLDDRSIDKKRSSDDAVVEPPSEPQAVSINILVAKKRKKVNGSSTPIATM